MSYTGLVQPTAMTSLEEVIDDTTPLINKVYSSDKAEALVTPASLLEKVKTVDGLGSGLDADLLRGLPADFGSSLAASGWQMLPSGLILQWGADMAATSSKIITFTIAFPSELVFVSATGIRSTATTIATPDLGVKPWSKTGMTVTQSEPVGMTWLAIGY